MSSEGPKENNLNKHVHPLMRDILNSAAAPLTNNGPYTVTHITKTVKHIVGNGKTISVTDPDYDEDRGPLLMTPSSQWCDLLNHAHAAGRASRDAEVEELTKRLAEKDEVLRWWNKKAATKETP